ncbi:hypothetical protein SAMN06265219_10564 [Gracilimonas mengyeensis]|uniref:Uncharacterized protein n=1 Tax=Gracilimonas mengyeensis TaxID=1302730 RepID=A0A521CF41_9BACT|nr:hypothetical protein SAMN06265219_10564 [Gracilimonas mengyeensis]
MLNSTSKSPPLREVPGFDLSKHAEGVSAKGPIVESER